MEHFSRYGLLSEVEGEADEPAPAPAPPPPPAQPATVGQLNGPAAVDVWRMAPGGGPSRAGGEGGKRGGGGGAGGAGAGADEAMVDHEGGAAGAYTWIWYDKL